MSKKPTDVTKDLNAQKAARLANSSLLRSTSDSATTSSAIASTSSAATSASVAPSSVPNGIATPLPQTPATPTSGASPETLRTQLAAQLQGLTPQQLAVLVAKAKQANLALPVTTSPVTSQSSSSSTALPSRSAHPSSATHPAAVNSSAEVKTRHDRPSIRSSQSLTAPMPALGTDERKHEAEDTEQRIAAISAEMKTAMEAISKLYTNVQRTMGAVFNQDPIDENLAGQYSALLAEIEPNYRALQQHESLFEEQRPAGASLRPNRNLVNSGYADQFSLDPSEMRQRLLATLDIDAVITDIKQTITVINTNMNGWNRKYTDIMMGKTRPVVVPATAPAVQPAPAVADEDSGNGIVIESVGGTILRRNPSSAVPSAFSSVPRAPVAPSVSSLSSLSAPGRPAPRVSVGGATSSASVSSVVGTTVAAPTAKAAAKPAVKQAPAKPAVASAPQTASSSALSAVVLPSVKPVQAQTSASIVSSAIGSSPVAQPVSQPQQHAQALAFLGLLFAQAAQGNQQAAQALAMMQAQAQPQSGNAPAMLPGFSAATAQSQQQSANQKLVVNARRLIKRLEGLKPSMDAFKAYANPENAEVVQVSGTEPHPAGVRVDPSKVETNRQAVAQVEAQSVMLEEAITSLKAYTNKTAAEINGLSAEEHAVLSSLVTDIGPRCDSAVQIMGQLEQAMEQHVRANSGLYF